jgi:hypothetical protein
MGGFALFVFKLNSEKKKSIDYIYHLLLFSISTVMELCHKSLIWSLKWVGRGLEAKTMRFKAGMYASANARTASSSRWLLVKSRRVSTGQDVAASALPPSSPSLLYCI